MPQKLSIRLEELGYFLNGHEITLNPDLIKEAKALEALVEKLQKDLANAQK